MNFDSFFNLSLLLSLKIFYASHLLNIPFHVHIYFQMHIPFLYPFSENVSGSSSALPCVVLGVSSPHS